MNFYSRYERFIRWVSYRKYPRFYDDSDRDYYAEWETTPLHRFLSGKWFN